MSARPWDTLCLNCGGFSFAHFYEVNQFNSSRDFLSHLQMSHLSLNRQNQTSKTLSCTCHLSFLCIFPCWRPFSILVTCNVTKWAERCSKGYVIGSSAICCNCGQEVVYESISLPSVCLDRVTLSCTHVFSYFLYFILQTCT